MPISDLRRLRDNLADPATLRTETQADDVPQPASQYDGSAEGGALWLSVDPRCRLLTVDVSTSWRQRLAPERFADALFAAYRSAVRKALSANFAMPRREPDVRPAPATDREVRSPNGYVTLLVHGGVLTGVTGSVAGLKSANPNLLRQDLMDVFREANLTA